MAARASGVRRPRRDPPAAAGAIPEDERPGGVSGVPRRPPTRPRARRAPFPRVIVDRPEAAPAVDARAKGAFPGGGPPRAASYADSAAAAPAI